MKKYTISVYSRAYGWECQKFNVPEDKVEEKVDLYKSCRTEGDCGLRVKESGTDKIVWEELWARIK